MEQTLLFISDNLLLSIAFLLIVIFLISLLIFRLVRKIIRLYIKAANSNISKMIGYFFSETVLGILILSTLCLSLSITGEEIDKMLLCLAIFGYVKAIIYAIYDASENKKTEV